MTDGSNKKDDWLKANPNLTRNKKGLLEIKKGNTNKLTCNFIISDKTDNSF